MAFAFEVAALIGQIATDSIEVVFMEACAFLDIDLAASDIGLTALNLAQSLGPHGLHFATVIFQGECLPVFEFARASQQLAAVDL